MTPVHIDPEMKKMAESKAILLAGSGAQEGTLEAPFESIRIRVAPAGEPAPEHFYSFHLEEPNLEAYLFV